MKKFLDNVFKPYLFPLIVLIIGAYLKAGKNLSGLTNFFSESSNSFIKFFSRQFYVWEVILYFLVVFILIRLYRLIFKRKSNKENKMIKATKRILHEMECHINGTDKFLFKYDPKVIDEEYFIDNLRPYCMNCSPSPLRMTKRGYGDFRCNCGKKVDYRLKKDVESRIITALEENEK
jgi:hypothetical protein